MKWLEVCIHTTTEAIEPITNILYDEGIQGVVIEDALDLQKKNRPIFGEMYDLDLEKYPKEGAFIKFYLHESENISYKMNHISKKIDQLKQFQINVGTGRITYQKKEEDWATSWKQYYKPHKITKTFTIVPSWETYKPTAEEHVITMDPGMAFGTGTHETTVLAAQALEKVICKDDIVFDVGCGSGILSIIAAKLGAKKVFAYDLDEVAVKSTLSNRDLNRLTEQIVVQKNDLLSGIIQDAHVIVANILAEIILPMITDAWKLLKPSGYFITSGIIKKKANIVKLHLENAGFQVIEQNEQNHWVSFTAQKMS